MSAKLQFSRQTFYGRPALDTAVSRAILMQVAAGNEADILRIYRPEPVVAFGRQDVREGGFSRAVQVAREHGFASVIRLVGGRAAVYHPETIGFALARRETDPHLRTFARFEETAEILRASLVSMGVDARVGEVPREYCPGDYSINARGKTKIAGMGQRIISNGAHLGGIVVVRREASIVEVLTSIYEELNLDLDPATIGSVQDEADVSWNDVEAAILEEFGSRFELSEITLDSSVLELAAQLEPDHRAPLA